MYNINYWMHDVSNFAFGNNINTRVTGLMGIYLHNWETVCAYNVYNSSNLCVWERYEGTQFFRCRYFVLCSYYQRV